MARYIVSVETVVSFLIEVEASSIKEAGTIVKSEVERAAEYDCAEAIENVKLLKEIGPRVNVRDVKLK